MKPKLLLGSLSLVSILICADASNAQNGDCPKIKPRSRQEVVMMAASSDKNGCWVRQKDGKLVFVSKDTPDHYKPLPDAAPSSNDEASSTGKASATEIKELLAGPFRCSCPDQHATLATKSATKAQTEWLDGNLFHEPGFTGRCQGFSLNNPIGIWVMDEVQNCPESIFQQPPEVPFILTITRMNDGGYKVWERDNYDNSGNMIDLILKPTGNGLYGATYKKYGEEGSFEAEISEKLRWSTKSRQKIAGA